MADTYTSPDIAQQYANPYTQNGQTFFAQMPQGDSSAKNPIIMKPDQISSGVSLDLAQLNADTTATTGLAGGGTATEKTMADYIKELTPPQTATDTQYQGLLNDISGLTGQDTGREQAQIDAENASGATAAKKALTDINNELITKNAEYEKMFSGLGAGGGAVETAAVYNAQQAGLQRAKAADIGLITARAQVAQGNLALAQETANRAVDAKYATIEDKIKVKQAQINAILPQLDKEQKIQAQAQQQYLKDQADKVAERKDKIKANLALALSNNVRTQFANSNGEFFNARTGETYATPAEFFKAANVTSFEDAYAKGLISDVKAAADYSKYPASYQEYILAKQGGYTGSYNDYQNLDANRKRAVTNNITYNQSQDQLKQTDISQTNQNLSLVAGTDGYVNVTDWKRAYNDWINSGHLAKDFIDNFSGYVNPNSIDKYFGVKE